MNPSQIGKLYGISVGPGDPELITLKGVRILKSAPVVAFPAGIGGKPGIAQQIVSQLIHPHQTQVALNFPYVRDPEVLTHAWNESAEKLWHYLARGEDIAFVTEGDVSFYSTFTYLAQTLQRSHPTVEIEAIPGVCSPMAATAALGLPLTVREQRLLVLPALYAVSDLETALDAADVIVLMKIKSVYPEVWQILQRHHLLSSSVVVEWVSHPHQKIYADLGDRPMLELSYFSLLIIHVNPTAIALRA
ncbi:MAG: precorrin-2 C(20)-methyltransferase [Elainellaceae cyanobacterium]